MSFVSARELEAAREQRKKEVKEMREEVLREARESFEREKKREELKRARGEDTWIVPAVTKRLGFKGETSDKKKRKKKKEKKHKKHKVSQKTNESESDGRGSEGEEMWIEKGSSAPPPTESGCTSSGVEVPSAPVKLQRDDWMTMPLGASDKALSLLAERDRESQEQRQKQREKKEEANYLNKPGQHPRELNPFWRDGGRGLPSPNDGTESPQLPSSSQSPHNTGYSSSSRTAKTFCDGGHSWLLRAYKRALEQANDSGRSLDEVATERWGSIEKLHSLLRVAGINPDDPDAPPRGGGRREYLYSRARRLDRDSDRRSVEEFDRRRERAGERRRGNRQEEEEGDRERRRRNRQEEEEGDRGRRRRNRQEEEEGDRERRRNRQEEEEGDRERKGDGERRRGGGDGRRQEGDIERRKRDWKKRFQRPPPEQPDSSSQSEFLRPGDLDQGPHSHSTGIRTGLTTTPSSGRGWRKKMATSDDPVVAMEISSGSGTAGIGQSEPEAVREAETTREPLTSEAGERVGESAVVGVSEEPVTEALLNSLGAKLMKAELMGNQAKVDKLKRELERLREVKKSQERSGNESPGAPRAAVREEKTLVLMKTDRFGREKPVEIPSTSRAHRPQPKAATTHTKRGKREKYFHDDDRYSLRELVEQERMMTADETHAAIARMASKFVPATGADETVDDVIDSKSAMKYDEAKELEKAKKRSITENRKMADAVERCQLCFDSPAFNKHLLVAVGMNTYLCAPWHVSLTEGHCYIVPMEHVTCSLFLDENVWSEVEIFRKGLTQMFADRDLDVVFMETFTSVKRKTHMYIDCVPLPRDEGELAPMYFKKAILESDEEWAQNKKLIDTREKGVRGSLPAGLPYFFAEFGVDGGFGHVIEDADLFPHYFGREVVGGLLDLSPRLWLKPRREDFDAQKAKVTQLSKWWAPYDWTQKLKQ